MSQESYLALLIISLRMLMRGKKTASKKNSCPSKVKVIQLLTLQKKIMLSKRVNGKCQVRLLMSYGENHVY